jgi:hypothetical protein
MALGYDPEPPNATRGELRNVLVHEYKSKQPLVVSSESTVRRIQIIGDELLSPVDLVDLFRPRVEICSKSDPIRPWRIRF